MQMRPYQQAAREAVHREWDEGRNRTLLVLPTGCGKTIVFAKITEDEVRSGSRVLILAHRGELLQQAADKLERTSGLKCAVEKAEQTCLGEWYRVTVGSVQTLMRQKRLAQFPPDYFQTIIIDEAHHAISGSYQVILDHFFDAHVLGVTATPDRGDKQNLGKVFDSLAYEYTLPQAIHEGYLTPIRALTVPVQIDFTHVGTAAGDYKPGDIATALDPYLDQIAAEMAKHCADRKTVVFLPLVKTSQKFRDILCQHGFRAAEVNGESEDREQVLQDFADGKYNVLCNSMLLTEGWDCPEVDCVVVLRSTKVRALYCQMVGRGTRLAEGKDHLLLLDFLWNTEKHELCRPACLICEDEEVQQKMTQQLEQQPGVPVDIEEAESKASEDVVADRESKLAEQLESMKKRKSKLVDPLQYEMSIQSQDLTWRNGASTPMRWRVPARRNRFSAQWHSGRSADWLPRSRYAVWKSTVFCTWAAGPSMRQRISSTALPQTAGVCRGRSQRRSMCRRCDPSVKPAACQLPYRGASIERVIFWTPIKTTT